MNELPMSESAWFKYVVPSSENITGIKDIPGVSEGGAQQGLKI